MVNWLSAQAELNKASADAWAPFAAHRERVTQLLTGDSPGGRLCVLGAGNCNDLHLARLLEVYSEIVLVDLDGSAVRDGVARQGLADDDRLRIEALDVSGVVERIQGWTPAEPIPPEDLRACVEAPDVQAARLAVPFEAVASLCLVSQLLDGVVNAVGSRHAQFIEALQAVRLGHLRLIARLTAPGGRGLLVTDLVSTETSPDLSSTPEPELPGRLVDLIAQRNFFTGLNPAVLVSLFGSDGVLRSEVAAAILTPPWLWDLGPRQYAVYGIELRKR